MEPDQPGDIAARLGAALPQGTLPAKSFAGTAAQTTSNAGASPVATASSRKPESLRDLEMRAILEGLERNHGNKAKTAEELGISLKTLYNKLHQMQEAAPVA